MRNMLRNVISGQPSTKGLAGGALKHAATRRALESRGLLDPDLKPTEAGLAVFGLRKPATYVVWHLIGPQGCGKTRYAEACIAAIHKLGGLGVWMDSYAFQRGYSANSERIADHYPGLTVLMIEDNKTLPGGTPPHYMQGDRVIDLTDYLPVRRPGIEGLQTKIRLNQPNWPEDMVQVQAKHQYERGFAGEALPW
ncbi:MAG: hypothetical protein LWW96_18245 [Acidovorax sp.]|nr:hypothetical protein [Acidovorax sp.]